MSSVHACQSLGRAVARLIAPLLLASIFALLPLTLYAGTITVDGTTCTLPDAITAANTDTGAGGCTAGSGPDTLRLTAPTYTLTSGPSDFTATPAVTTTIVISGGVGGATVQRNSVDPFRLFKVDLTGNLTLQNVTVRNGLVMGVESGGGILADGKLTLVNSHVVANSAPTGGGIFANNATLIDSTVGSNIADSYGGGIYAFALALTDSVVFSNIASGGGGGGLVIVDTATLTRTEILSNTTNATGGGIFNAAFATLTLNSSTVRANQAAGFINMGGGGIYNEFEGRVTLNNSTLSFNSALFGGGIDQREGTLSLNNSTVSDNTAVAWGGGIGSLLNSTLIINNSGFAGNRAEEGGGLYIHGGTVKITDTIFFSNTAIGLGGGIRNQDTDNVTLSNVSVISNSALLGGGILNFNGNMLVEASKIHSNTAELGGGIFTSGSGTSVTLINSTLRSNRADFGGGIHNQAGTVSLTNGEISANAAITGGGGIYNNSAVNATGVIITRNTAGSSGGAVFQANGGTSISQSCIVNNSAVAVHKSGGGVINADNNWWGASDGPGGDGPGAGDSVTTDVLFSPPLTSAILGCSTRAADVGFAAKSTPLGTLLPGQPLTYTLTVTNHGAESIYKLDLVNSLPAGFVLSQVISTGATISPTASGFRITQLNSAQTTVLHYVGKVAPTLNSNQVLSNTVNLVHPLANLSASSSNNVVVPLLSWSSSSYVADEENGVFTATLNLSPANPFAAVTVEVESTDSAADFASAAIQVITFPPGSSSQPVGVTIAKDGVIAPRTIRLELQSPAGAAVDGASGVEATLNLTEGDSAPALAVTSSPSSARVYVGDTITYTYRITNTGNVTLTAISAADDALGVVSALAGRLAPNASRSTTLTYLVQPNDFPGTLVNTVTVTGTHNFGAAITRSASAEVPLQGQMYFPKIVVFEIIIPGSAARE